MGKSSISSELNHLCRYDNYPIKPVLLVIKRMLCEYDVGIITVYLKKRDDISMKAYASLMSLFYD
ncbi:hypothetical protein SPWS13_0635 [Shewanella putrefaciens]|nr:hypothetical protein SPWS13_0635 [Shewanella putrefaciens]